MSVDLNPKNTVGVVPSGGVRNWISFSGGNWAAKWGAGSVLVGARSFEKCTTSLVALIVSKAWRPGLAKRGSRNVYSEDGDNVPPEDG